jgi:VWFA-related protein
MQLDQPISRRRLFSALGLIPALRLLGAQQGAQQGGQQGAQQSPQEGVQQGAPQGAPHNDKPTFSTGVKVVNLYANVRDKAGAIVKDLVKDDFLLDEDGRAQEIRYFSQESDLPLTLGLLVDTSGSQRRLIEEERAASYRFFEQVLRPEKDVAFVIHFDFDVELLQDITSSRRLLEKALENLEAPTQQRQQRQSPQQQTPFPFPGGGGGRRRNGGGGGGGGGGRSGGGTMLYDAVLLAADELMRKQSGRKALILLTDGVDTGSKVSLSSAVEAAQRADTLVYSILFEDSEMYGGSLGRVMGGRGAMGLPNGRKVLEQISRETGGRFFEVSKKHTLAKVYDDIDVDLRHQYSLGYSPDRTEAGGGYHRIRLTTKQKGLIVQTREGYYGA